MQMIFKKARQHSKRGFSLTELSISISIIAMIAGSALSVAVTSDFEAKRTQTNDKLDRLEEALAAFLINNLRLPCPADATTAPDAAGFGEEETSGSDPASCAANFSTTNVNAGVVPTVTLNLPAEFMVDGWGNRFTYAVDTRFTNNDITNVNCTANGAVCFIDTDETSAVLTIKDDSSTPSNRTEDGVYVLFSHGENGHGAYPRNGGSGRINAYLTGTLYTNAAAYSEELENAEFSAAGAATTYDANFISRDYIKLELGTAANRKYFDDILRYKTKSQLVHFAGELSNDEAAPYQVMFLDSICRTAKAIYDETSTDCDNADDEDNCISFASNIYLRCLDDEG